MVEYTARTLTVLGVNLCYIMATTVITIGVAKAFLFFLASAFHRVKTATAIRKSRIELGNSFYLGLGFLIGASILNTAVIRTWSEIGRLVSIIVVRATLNYLLLQEIGKRYEKDTDAGTQSAGL